jgi:hypothetical protein
VDLIRKGCLSRTYSAVEGVETVGELRLSRWRDRGDILAQGRVARARRTASFGRAFLLEGDGVVLVKATRPSLLARSLVVEADGGVYRLAWRWSRGHAATVFELFRESTAIGIVLFDDGFFRSALPRRAVAELPADLLLRVRLFIAWLAMLKRYLRQASGPRVV